MRQTLVVLLVGIALAGFGPRSSEGLRSITGRLVDEIARNGVARS